jgi:hypothetical protein
MGFNLGFKGLNIKYWSFLIVVSDNLSVPETSVRNDHYLLRNSSEDRSSHTAYPSHLDVLKIGPIGCPEMSARNCHYWLRNIPEECSSSLLRGWTLKSPKAAGFSQKSWRIQIQINHQPDARVSPVYYLYSSRGVLPTVLRRCVWSRNIKNGCSIYV